MSTGTLTAPNLISCFPNGEPTGPWVEHLFDFLIQTYEKLKELGFTYYNGEVSVIDTQEGENV